jgi:hypothetical protein
MLCGAGGVSWVQAMEMLCSIDLAPGYTERDGTWLSCDRHAWLSSAADQASLSKQEFASKDMIER